MKKIFLLLGFYLIFHSVLFSQENLSGYYYSESGIYLQIEDNQFKLIMPNSASAGWYSEIMAEGTMTPIDDSFIELNSYINQIHKIWKTIKINEQVIKTPTDSILLKFIIPYSKTKLKIVVYTDSFKTFDVEYPKNKEMNISKTKNISVYVRPDYIIPHTFVGLYYGITAFYPMDEYVLEENTNYVEIEIPAMDNSFFERYYIQGEYAKVTNDTITWKGEVYIKGEKQ